MPVDDAKWMQPAVSAWETGMEGTFGFCPAALPLMIVIGSECVWRVGAGENDVFHGRKVHEITFGKRAHAVYGARHEGHVEMPAGQVVTPRPLAFSAPSPDGSVFIAVASTGVWRKHIPEGAIPDIRSFIIGVAVHELVHTQQANLLERLNKSADTLPSHSDLDDELIERKFGATAGYVTAMESQKADLIAAIRENNPEKARRLARAVLDQYRQRQVTYFSGENAIFRTLEDDFLTMEGVAVWFTFQVFPPEGAAGGSPAEIANYYEARSKGSWVQSHGGLFVALLDHLDSDWRRRAFKKGVTIAELVELAVQNRPTR